MTTEMHGAALTLTDAVELATVERSGFIESRHIGAGVVTDPDGSVLLEVGDASKLIFPRSCLKLAQAVAVLRTGVALHDEQIVLATASHSGTPEHIAVVDAMLSDAGLGEDALQCPADWPGDSASAAVARTSGGRRRVAMNCSGKHAAFLAACVREGFGIDDYLDPLHPLQGLIRGTVEEFTSETVQHVGTDGCGAPLFTTSLRGLARLAGRVALGAEPATRALATAIREHPWAIAGPGHPNTVVIEELGLIAKGGAEGVLVIAAADGRAAAVKVLDGSARATTLVALELLARAGVVDRADAERVAALTTEPVLGGGETVGAISVAF